MVVHLNSPGRAAVGVAVKPPDESFRRLETARPNPPLYLSLYAAPILGEGRPTGTTNRLGHRPGYLSSDSHTAYTLPPKGPGVVWAPLSSKGILLVVVRPVSSHFPIQSASGSPCLSYMTRGCFPHRHLLFLPHLPISPSLPVLCVTSHACIHD